MQHQSLCNTPLSGLVAVRCCICDTLDAKPVGIGRDFEYHSCDEQFVTLECVRCGLVFLSPRPSISDLDRIYPPEYHAYIFSSEQFGLSHFFRQKLEKARLAAVCKDLPPGARILDVGCGDGFHLNLLRTYGQPSWSLEGVDASMKAVVRAREQGLTVHHGRLEDVALASSSFDLVLVIATLEHVENPRRLLEEARRLTKIGGRIVIVTDNVSSPDFHLWKRRYWGGYHFPRHWNLFSKGSLNRLAEKCQLRVERAETIVSPVNWVYSIRNCLADHGANRTLLKQLSLKGPFALAAFTIWDTVMSAFGAGALLRFSLRRESE